MSDICALCQKNSDLQNSHLIPKWAYRRISELIPKGEVKAPALISEGKAIAINKQTTRHLLCVECEQRFSKSEDYVAGLTELEKGKIKLFNQVTRLDTPRKVLATLSPEIDSGQIAYFAASIFWRGKVMTGDCELGPYEPKFRQYLLGLADFPDGVAISLGLFEESPIVDARGWVSEPASAKTRMGWLHGFLLNGLAFRCWVGKSIPKEWRQISLAGPNPIKYVSIINPRECPDFLAAVEVVGNAKPLGKLALLK